MHRRLLIALIALLVAPASAGAVPGGALSGRIAVDWSSPGWSGHAEISLDPGAGPKAKALAALRAAQPHYLRPTGYFLQGAHILALRGERSTTFDCDAGPATTNATTVLGLRDTRLPFTLDTPRFDLRRGRGTTTTHPWEDNPGYPGLPTHLSYFLPVPGRAAVRRSSSGCGESFAPTSQDDEINAFDWRGEAAVPVDFVRWLDDWAIPLRHRSAGWGATGSVRATDFSPFTFDVTFDLRLVGKLTSWNSLCQVPEDSRLGRTPRSALAALRRAGFPRARFAGAKRTAGYPPGHLFVDPHFSGSGLALCLTSRPRVYRAVRYRG